MQEKGADYFISLKENQPGVRAHVVAQFLSPTATANASGTSRIGSNIGNNIAQQAGLRKMKTIQEAKPSTDSATKAKKTIPTASEAKTETRTILVPAPTAGNEYIFKKRPRAAMAK